MSADDPSDRKPAARASTIARVFELIRNILALERAVGDLKAENAELEQRVAALQRQVDRQNGQLEILVDFVREEHLRRKHNVTGGGDEARRVEPLARKRLPKKTR